MRFSRKKNSRFSRQVKQSFSRNQEALIEQQRAQLKATEKNLFTLRKQFQALFERTADAMMILENGAFTDGNPACLELYGCRNRAEFLGVHPSELSPPTQEDGQPSRDKADEMIRLSIEKGSHRFEWLHQTRQGKVFPAEVLLTVVGEGKVPAICAIVRDITERKRIEKEIRFHADYDNLTGLPNRRLILDRIEQSLASSRRHGFFNALLFVDLDRFKFINDSLGHSLGDQLLVQIADSLRQHIREEDTVSRFGGDEFLILLKHLGKDREVASLRAERMAEVIRQSISRAYDINEHSVFATASIGIYLFPDEEEGLDDIIKQADTAMYSAKDTGRNRVAFFQAKMQEAVVKRLHLEKELRDAVKTGQIVPFFQPQISSEGKIIGVEALARWHHPERGFVPPDEFIAIAEDIGIIHELGDQILRSSLEQTLGLRQCLSHLSVNISPNQFRHPDFHDTIAGLISHHDIPEQFLTLEITEGVVIDDFENTVERLSQLRALGVRVSLDDFGTGYSSLSYLKRLPIDELKIDRSFIIDIEHDPRDALLVQTIISIAHQFGLVTVAEGVENESQKALLHGDNCGVFQGYHFSRPLPFEELQSFIDSCSNAQLHAD